VPSLTEDKHSTKRNIQVNKAPFTLRLVACNLELSGKKGGTYWETKNSSFGQGFYELAIYVSVGSSVS
jgi:hypothetical protein